MRSLAPALILIGSALLAPAARALDERGAMAVIEKFLAAQKFEDASASPGQHVIADLNGDGKPDIVLQWDEMGATWSRPKLSVFIDQGRNYRTLTTDLTGQIEKLSVSGPVIRLDTLTLGPKDARCCPSVKKQVRYRWANNKLGPA
jgi:LppP/LprE lipoprotein